MLASSCVLREKFFLFVFKTLFFTRTQLKSGRDMCAPHRDKSNFRLNRQFSFHRYILEVLAEEAIKFLFMERESCDYDTIKV